MTSDQIKIIQYVINSIKQQTIGQTKYKWHTVQCANMQISYGGGIGAVVYPMLEQPINVEIEPEKIESIGQLKRYAKKHAKELKNG